MHWCARFIQAQAVCLSGTFCAPPPFDRHERLRSLKKTRIIRLQYTKRSLCARHPSYSAVTSPAQGSFGPYKIASLQRLTSNLFAYRFTSQTSPPHTLLRRLQSSWRSSSVRLWFTAAWRIAARIYVTIKTMAVTAKAPSLLFDLEVSPGTCERCRA
jgi:hypothetical protein